MFSSVCRSLVFDIQYVPREDSFRTTNKVLRQNFPNHEILFLKNDLNALIKYDGLNQVCQQVSYGIQALFGPSDLILGSHVQSLCDALVMLSKTPKLERFSILTSTRISLI